MILPIHQLVRARICDAVARLYNIEATDPVLADIAVELAPTRALGDFAVPLAFSLARRLRKAARTRNGAGSTEIKRRSMAGRPRTVHSAAYSPAFVEISS